VAESGNSEVVKKGRTSWAALPQANARWDCRNSTNPDPASKMNKGSLVLHFFISYIEAGLGSAKQRHSKVGIAGRHN
jgi:hypothetical protein